MAKTLELAFVLAGKLASSFPGAAKAAAAHLGAVEQKANAISAAAQKRQDANAFKNLRKATGEAGKAFSNLAGEITGTALVISGAITGVSAAIYGVAKSSARYADASIKNAQAVGMNTAAFTELSYAAKMAGADEQAFVNASGRLNNTVQDALAGNKVAMENLARAGITTLHDSQGNLKTTEQLWAEMSDTFASMPDGIGKTALAMDLFGRSGTKLIPLLNGGSAGLNQMREDARRLGISLSEADAKNAEAFNDSFANIGESIRGVSLIIGKQLWPALTEVHTAISDWIAANGQLLAQNLPGWIEEFRSMIPGIKVGLREFWESVVATAKHINAVVQSMGGWVPLVRRLVQAWLAYRALRIGKALFDTGKSILALKSKFVDAMPAIGRWMAANQAATGRARIFGKGVTKSAVKGIRMLASGLNTAGRRLGTFAKTSMIALYGYAKAAAVAIAGSARFALSTGKTAAAGLASFAKSTVLAAGGALKFAAAVGMAAVKSLASFAAMAAGAAVGALKSFAAAMYPAIAAAVKFSIALMANPIGLVIAAIAALAGTAYLVYKYWDGITSAMSAAWDWTKSVFVAGWNLLPDWLTAPLVEVYDRVAGFGQRLVDGFSVALDAVKAFFGAKGALVGDAFDKGILAGIYEAFKQFNPVFLLRDALYAVVDYLLNFDIASAGMALVNRLADGILSAWASVKDGIVSTLTDWIPGGSSIVNGVGAAASSIGNAASWAGNALSSISPFADGGIVRSPQLAMIGEAGPEVVVPITRPRRARELMGAAAGMMGMSGNTGGSPAITVTFAPSITIAGDADRNAIVPQIQQTLSNAKAELESMLREITYNDNRIALW